MNNFIGTVTYTGEHSLDHIDADCLSMDTWDQKTLFLCGQTEYSSSDELIDDFKKNITWLHSWDISVSTEDDIVILNSDIEEDGLYECVSFEGPGVEYHQIVDRFHDIWEAVAVREAEESKRYENKVIKVDFIY